LPLAPRAAPRHNGAVSRRQIDITPDLMLRAYRAGLFPMAESRRGDRLYWLDPERRGVIPLDGGFHLPRRLLRTVLSGPYRVTADADFQGVISGCAAPAPGARTPGSTRRSRRCSSPCTARATPIRWRSGRGMGRWWAASTAWCSARPSSGRACSAAPATPPRWRWCIWWRGCGSGGFTLLDAQFLTEHLAQFGAREVPRADYKRRLANAVSAQAGWLAAPEPAALEAAIRALRPDPAGPDRA
jgi:leucyl/phenylalanyl-tRNA--protein transferase